MLKNIIYLFRNKILIILFLYICSIVLFAAIYRILPQESFYHSTVQYENSSFNKDVIEITTVLTKQLSDVLLKNLPNNIKIVDFRVNDISLTKYPNEIILKYFFSFEYKNEAGLINGMGFNDSLVLNLKTYLITDNKLFLLKSHENNNVFITNNVLQIFNYNSVFDSKPNGFIEIDKKIYTKIIGLGDAYKGFPKNLSGEFFRMLYLSAGIATTMTFGDILPITSIARILIIVQNLITLVFLGLLIEAITCFIKKAET